jgi:hypothetical protein
VRRRNYLQVWARHAKAGAEVSETRDPQLTTLTAALSTFEACAGFVHVISVSMHSLTNWREELLVLLRLARIVRVPPLDVTSWISFPCLSPKALLLKLDAETGVLTFEMPGIDW